VSLTVDDAARADDHPVVRLRGVGVRFGTNRVLENVSLDLHAGSITALLGTNGAGKSTLIGTVSGANAHYTGEIEVNGLSARISSPTIARRAGIETVHQKISDGIVPGLSVADNVVLADLAARGRAVLRRSDTEAAARAALSRLGLSWSDEVLRADAGRLGTSDAQLLVLARALRGRPRLLILDEPTSALTAAEADRLFEVLRALRVEGLAILFVSHRFGEIERLADRVVVLRDGSPALDVARPFDWHAALEAMLGVPTELQQHVVAPLPPGEPVLRIRDAELLAGAAPLDLTVHAGQVTGVLGLLGAGKTELAEILCGVREAGTATLEREGRPYMPRTPAAAQAAGIVLVPEDRQRQGIQPGWSIAHTVSLPELRRVATAWGVLRGAEERRRAAAVVADFGVVTTSVGERVDDLSGGNQQKVIVGRWLATDPQVAVLDEPFRGVDIGARRTIGAAVRARASEGKAVVVLTSDVDEVLEVADRIVVLVSGRITLDVAAGERDRATIVAALLDDPNHPEESA
jgi:simple sugar transport system ATP-binding protein